MVRGEAKARRCHAELREVIADLNSVLRGSGTCFRTGNAAQRFNQLDTYVWKRWLASRGHSFHDLGLHELRGTVGYPQAAYRREAAKE